MSPASVISSLARTAAVSRASVGYMRFACLPYLANSQSARSPVVERINARINWHFQQPGRLFCDRIRHHSPLHFTRFKQRRREL